MIRSACPAAVCARRTAHGRVVHPLAPARGRSGDIQIAIFGGGLNLRDGGLPMGIEQRHGLGAGAVVDALIHQGAGVGGLMREGAVQG